MEAILTSYLVINKNTPIPKDGIIFTVDDPPTKHCLDNILASFDGGNDLNVALSIGDDSHIYTLPSTTSISVDFEEEGKIEGRIYTNNEGTVLHCLVLYFMDMAAVPMVLDEKQVIHYPEQGMKIGLQLEEELEAARGWDEIKEIHAQLKHPSGTVDNIRGSTPNYIWRGRSLYLNIRVGDTYPFRIRFSTELGWVDWSEWMTLVPRRKMSL